MNISTHSCRNTQVRARRLNVAVLLLHVFVLHSPPVFAHSANGGHLYHLSTALNFNLAQCPSQFQPMKEAERIQRLRQIPAHHFYQHYNPYKSIFTQQPLRPLTLEQQLAMLDVFVALGISAHRHNLITMINLTQKQNLSILTALQLKQATDWREVEGAISQEKACLNNSECKHKTSTALFEMGMYDSQIPNYQHYDYTLLLGGSIQQMQWRMLMLLSLFDESLEKNSLDLGEIVALTCNRVVLTEEADGTSTGTMFDVAYDPDTDRAKANIAYEQEQLLTETSAYQAIYHSLKLMSESPEYFERFKESSIGYHTTRPVSFLGEDSFEKKLYNKEGSTFQLSDRLPEVLTEFFKRHPAPEIIETSMHKVGQTLKKRPTTKKTVKEWLQRRNNRLSCKEPDFCKILVISNAPNTYYQHIAVLQALEESITNPTRLTYEVSTAGPGVSREIPTNALLDNLTKLLYLEAYHPEY